MESQKESLDILEDIVSSMEKEITANKVQIVGERIISRLIWKRSSNNVTKDSVVPVIIPIQ